MSESMVDDGWSIVFSFLCECQGFLFASIFLTDVITSSRRTFYLVENKYLFFLIYFLF